MNKKGKCFSMVNRGQRKKSDLYQTPFSLTKQLLSRENFQGLVLEPACGNRAISKMLIKYSYGGISDDLQNGYDFLKENRIWDNIITNPPFSLADEFILKAKELYKNKIAFLMPLNYLHGQKRYEKNIFKELVRIYVFTRYPLLTDTVREDGKYETGMMVYAWYIWEKGYKGKAEINWIDNNKFILRKNEIY